jgi:integrase
VDFPTRQELNILIYKAQGRWRPFVITAIFTGLRMSELRGLVWESVDLDKGVIHVRQRASAWNRIGPPKSKAGKRDIPRTPMVVNALRQWRLASPCNELGLVFPADQGPIMRMGVVTKQWSLLLKRCGLPHYKFHSLRHAAASLFIEHLKWTPKKLQTVMGHASVTMAMDRYGHLLEDLSADAADMARLEEAVRSA